MGKVRHTTKFLRELESLPAGIKQLVRIDEVEPRLRSYQFRHLVGFRAEVCLGRKRFTKKLADWPCDIEEQRNAARRFALEVKGGEINGSGSIKVRDYFRNVVSPDVLARNKTAKETVRRFERVLDLLIGDMRLDRVTPGHLERLPLDLQSRGLANQTVNHYLVDVRRLFRRAEEQQLIPRSPARFLRNLQVSKAPVVPELTVSRLPELVAAMRADQSVFGDYGVVLLGAGLRDSECRDLKGSQIDEAITSIYLADNKAGRPFYAPVNGLVREVLERRLKLHGRGYLFPSPRNHGEPIGYPRAFFERVSARMGVRVKPHDMRRLFGTAAAMATGSIDMTGRLLNHAGGSGVAVTKRYITYAAPELQRASEAAERLLIGNIKEIGNE